MIPNTIPFPKPKIKAKFDKLSVYDDMYMIKDIASPAMKHVKPGDTFFAYLVTKGIEIAYIV